MALAVERVGGSYRLSGMWPGTASANKFLAHLESRAFSVATIRAYAYDLLNFARFLTERHIALGDVCPSDIFDWVDWQSVRRPGTGKVVPISAGRSSAAASVNRRVAAVRAFFEHQLLSGSHDDNPVPAPRRGQGLRPKARGLLGHLAREGSLGRPARPPTEAAARVARTTGCFCIFG